MSLPAGSGSARFLAALNWRFLVLIKDPEDVLKGLKLSGPISRDTAILSLRYPISRDTF